LDVIMSTSLAEALSLVEQRIPRDFFDEARRTALDGWARNAPPVAWAGFECPLGAERWVDFHQGFRREDLPYLTAWLEHHAREGEHAWIAPLLKFCAEWGRADSLFFRSIPNLIFEYDVRDHPERISSPSIFIAMERVDDESPAEESVTPAIKRTVIESALAQFLDPARVAMLMGGIDRCLSSAPINASISHLGLMLSRNTPAVRINVRSLHYDQFSSFLAAIGWNGPREKLEDAIAESYAFAERINLAIDVGEQIGPAIGLECSTYVHNPMRWERILRDFVARSICTEEQHLGLSKWWGRQSPSTNPITWPSNLIAEGLLQNADRFAVIDRYISHFKMTWQADAPRKFKCYLGFNHRFIARAHGKTHGSMREPGPNPYARPLDRIASVPRADEAENAIARGIDFLLRNRLQSGLWLDFPSFGEGDPWLAFGTSDEWVSVYVAGALGAFGREDARSAAAWVWRLLNHRRKGEGWGYSCVSPADADSTVWGLRLAQALDVSDTAPVQSARDFLRRHQHDNGGLATYLPDAAIRYFAELATPEINAWCEPHVCVTAAAAHIPELQADCLRFLRASQAGDGRWDSYWWTDSEYSTGLATAALAQSRADADRVRVASAIKWAMARVGVDGGVHSAGCKTDAPFSTAWNLRTLLAAPEDPQARALALKSLQWLVREQRADGSWSGSAWMKTPPVNSSSKVGTILAQDRNGNFTTASVLSSLRIARAIH
jgi:squalene-hopene/tetraprenyl-beta-curcumene cyclase